MHHQHAPHADRNFYFTGHMQYIIAVHGATAALAGEPALYIVSFYTLSQELVQSVDRTKKCTR